MKFDLLTPTPYAAELAYEKASKVTFLERNNSKKYNSILYLL
jgi:hypothetical protein